MKIKTYRILYLISVSLLSIIDVFALIYSLLFIKNYNLAFENALLEILGYVVILILTLFQIYWISLSYKKGSQILPLLCFNQNKTRNNFIYYLSITLSIISFGLTLLFFIPLFYLKFNIRSFTNITYILFCLICFSLCINSLFVFLYTKYMGREDLSIH